MLLYCGILHLEEKTYYFFISTLYKLMHALVTAPQLMIKKPHVRLGRLHCYVKTCAHPHHGSFPDTSYRKKDFSRGSAGVQIKTTLLIIIMHATLWV